MTVLQTALDAALAVFAGSPEFRAQAPDVHDRSAVEALATRLYEHLLGRPPAAGEAAGWTDYIAATADLAGAARGVLDSPAYAHVPRALTAQVRVLYGAFLGRDPTQAEVESWVSYLGRARAAVEDAFMASPEFQGRLQRLLPS